MIFYEVDIQTPTTIRGDDGWRPVLGDSDAAQKFTETQLSRFLNNIDKNNARLKYRVREVVRETRLRKL